MNNPIDHDKKSYPMSTWFFIIFSMLSLIVAVTSAVYTTKTNIDRDRISTINNINDDILHLTTMLVQNPHLNHLVASPEDYLRVSELVFKSLEKTSKQRLIELLLTEEAMAISLVNLYERILVELNYARSMRYKYRIQFLRYHLTNFEQGLLLNPRMLFLFRNSLEHVSQKAKEYYSNKVKNLGIAAQEQDDTGPILKALRRIEPKFSSSN